ncbi:MAG: TonB-dependent receptor [bacterium]
MTAWVGLDTEDATTRFGASTAQAGGEALRGGVRAATRRGGLLVGVDAEATRFEGTRAGTLALPRREGDASVFGQAPGDDVAEDAWSTLQVSAAAFARLDVRLLDRLDVSPGLRVEPTFTRGDRRLPGLPGAVEAGYDQADFPVDPRISTELSLGDGWALRAAGGRYRQLPDPADRSPVVGSTALEAAVAWHGLAGVRWRGPVEVELTGFGRQAEGLAVRSADPEVGEALVDAGEGRAFGGQLGLRLPSWGGWSGAAHYTLAWSDRRDAGGDWRSFEQDQRHAVTTTVGFASGAWRVGARFRLATGAPRPRVIGGVFDAAHGRFDPLFGPEPERLPAFAQLDLDAEYTRTVGAFEVAGLATVLNATARENVEERVYRFDYRQRGSLTGVPLTGLVGLRVRLK